MVHNILGCKFRLQLVLILLMFGYGSEVAHAQRIRNLVVNPGFEELLFDSCLRVGINSIKELKGWRNTAYLDYDRNGILRPRGGGDVFTTDSCVINQKAMAPNTIRGDQWPNSGKHFAGFSWVGSRGYLTGQLSEPLQIGQEYTLEVHLSLAEKWSTYYAKSFQILFHRDSVLLTLPYNLTPGALMQLPQWYYDTVQPVHIETNFLTDTIGWMKLKTQFVAIDSSVYFTLGNYTDVNYEDYLMITTDPRPKNRKTFYFVDDVAIYPNSDSITTEVPRFDWKVNNYPNPARDWFSVSYTLPEAGSVHIRVTDMLGKLVWEVANLFATKGDHTVEIDASSWAMAQYQISILYEGAGQMQIKHLKHQIFR